MSLEVILMSLMSFVVILVCASEKRAGAFDDFWGAFDEFGVAFGTGARR